MLIAPKEHEMHHRAQLMVVKRMLGITPHLTRHMEERIEKKLGGWQAFGHIADHRRWASA